MGHIAEIWSDDAYPYPLAHIVYTDNDEEDMYTMEAEELLVAV